MAQTTLLRQSDKSIENAEIKKKRLVCLESQLNTWFLTKNQPKFEILVSQKEWSVLIVQHSASGMKEQRRGSTQLVWLWIWEKASTTKLINLPLLGTLVPWEYHVRFYADTIDLLFLLTSGRFANEAWTVSKIIWLGAVSTIHHAYSFMHIL